MKVFRVMALVPFSYKGNEKMAGEVFDMKQEDYAYWGGFVKHVPRDLGAQRMTKPAPKTRRKATGGTDK